VVVGRVDAEVELVLMRFLSALASAPLSLLWMSCVRIHTRHRGKTTESLSFHPSLSRITKEPGLSGNETIVVVDHAQRLIASAHPYHALSKRSVGECDDRLGNIRDSAVIGQFKPALRVGFLSMHRTRRSRRCGRAICHSNGN
jgi:hypothetical protein